MVEENQLICQANYLAHVGDVEQVQHYASVDSRKRLEPCVTRDLFLVWTELNFILLGGIVSSVSSSSEQVRGEDNSAIPYTNRNLRNLECVLSTAQVILSGCHVGRGQMD